MIRLTNFGVNNPIYVNPDRIIGIYKNLDEGATHVHYCENDTYCVTESPAEVARKVLEWKLAMVDYRDTVRGYRQMARQALEELAGLHDKKLDAFVDGIIKQMEEPNHDAG